MTIFGDVYPLPENQQVISQTNMLGRLYWNIPENGIYLKTVGRSCFSSFAIRMFWKTKHGAWGDGTHYKLAYNMILEIGGNL